ncbi:hypothetical protein [Cronobacter phage vB_Cdu_VP8]|nr:hypothetical protein [Cronobacter phage vB_Cdu_VP8]
MKSFSSFLNEGAFEIKQAALKSGKGYTNDAEGRRQFELDYKQYGNSNHLLSAWKSFQVTGEIFDKKLQKAAPAKPEVKEKFPVSSAEFKKLVDANKKVMDAFEAAGKLAAELQHKMQPFYNGKKFDFRTQYEFFAVAGIKDIVADSTFRALIQKRIHIAEEALHHSKKL